MAGLCPDWTKAFGFTSACERLYAFRCCASRFQYIRSFMFDYSHLPTCSVEEEESRRPRRFHPRPRVAEGVQEAVAKLNGSRTNRVFEFFKIVVLERVGFAKHRKAAERKAAALAAADAEAGETATSLRTASTRKTGTRNAPAAAATAAAEGKARKKRGGRPADSPRRPKEPGSWTSRLTSSKT
jgi:hypothetical protein